MTVTVLLWSYFRDLAGCERFELELPTGTTIAGLHQAVGQRFPKLAAARRSTLVAVGVEYQPAEYVLQPGDQVSFFPPVQGG